MKTKIETAIEITTTLLLGKQIDNKRSQKSSESDQDQVRDNKSRKNDIVILGDYMIYEQSGI